VKKYYVAYFPGFSEDHWVTKFRHKNDKKSQLVPPHITLLLPLEMKSGNELRLDVERTTADFSKFKVRFKSAMVMPENGSNGLTSYVFLVPDEGFGDVLRLHDRLYSGRFSEYLRLDIPFVPHMTIGSNLNLLDAKKRTDELNAIQFSLDFTVDRLSIVEIDDPAKERIVFSTVLLK
jgi:2'-5' RNA ligase